MNKIKVIEGVVGMVLGNIPNIEFALIFLLAYEFHIYELQLGCN
jgi:hypothetical protein